MGSLHPTPQFSLGADATRTNWPVGRLSVRRYAPTAREQISDFRETLFRCTAECGIKPQLPRGCASHWSVAVRVFLAPRLSVPNGCACGEFAVSQIRTQFVRLAKDTAIVGLLADRGVEECLPNGECSFPRRVA